MAFRVQISTPTRNFSLSKTGESKLNILAHPGSLKTSRTERKEEMVNERH